MAAQNVIELASASIVNKIKIKTDGELTYSIFNFLKLRSN